MKDLMKNVTVEEATKVYEEKGICCIGDGGTIVVEVECEDYCEEC
jgi:hypothetical protein